MLPLKALDRTEEPTAMPPPIRPALKESLRLAPPISEPIPPPRKLAPKVPAPKDGPKKGIPKAAAAIGSTIGAAFLTTFQTFLATFFTPPQNFLIKPQNSGRPVSGLMLLSSLPTIYLSGSKPRSSIWSKRSFFSLGFSSRTPIGITVSPSAAWIT